MRKAGWTNDALSPVDAHRACYDKRRYTNGNKARDAAKRAGISSYRCFVCHGWHLTKVLKADFPQVREKLRGRK